MRQKLGTKGLRMILRIDGTKPKLVIYSYWTPRRVTNWINNHFPMRKVTKSLFAHNAQWGFDVPQIIAFAKAFKDIDNSCDCWKFGRTYYICPKS